MNEEIKAMQRQIDQLKLAVNTAAAHDAALKLVIATLTDQVPDTGRLLRDFNSQAEDTNIRTMYSSMPESFFQGFQEARATWEALLLAAHQAKPNG